MKTKWVFFLALWFGVGALVLLSSCALVPTLAVTRSDTPIPPAPATPRPQAGTPVAGLVEVVLKSAPDSPNLASFAVYNAAGKQVFQSDGAAELSYKLYLPIGVYRWVAQAPIPTRPVKCYIVPADYGYLKEGRFTAEKDPITIEVKLGRVMVPCTATPTLITPTVATTSPCPVPTQELPPRVAPVTSPTDELSQTIVVRPGNYDQVWVEAESGTFTVANASGETHVTITLLPNTIHHLKVTVHIRQTGSGGCIYGGYKMAVDNDENGNPLTIVQGNPVPPVPVTEAFGVNSFGRVKQLTRISFTASRRPWDVVFPQSDQLVTFGMGQGVQRWQLPGGQPAGEQMLNEQSMTTAAAFSPDGTWMATGSGGYDTSDDNQTSVRLWNLTTGEIRLLGHHTSTVESLAFNPSSTLLASGGNDNTVLLWDVASGSQVAKFEGDVVQLSDGSKLIQGMRQLFWDGNSAVIARGDAVIYEWSVPSGERLLVIGGEYKNMAFSPSNKRIAMVRDDGVYLKNPGSDPAPLLLNGQSSQGYQQVYFSPDELDVVALNSTTVTFWDAASKMMLATGPNPVGALVVLSPDWRYLARVNWDDTYVSVWGVQP